MRIPERNAYDPFYYPGKPSFNQRGGQDAVAERKRIDALAPEVRQEPEVMLYVKDGDYWVPMTERPRRMGFR